MEQSCTGDDTERWFPRRGGDPTYALSVCARCDAASQCRFDGISEEFGIWGGLRPTDRRQLRVLARSNGHRWPPATPADLDDLVELLDMIRELLGVSDQLELFGADAFADDYDGAGVDHGALGPVSVKATYEDVPLFDVDDVSPFTR